MNNPNAQNFAKHYLESRISMIPHQQATPAVEQQKNKDLMVFEEKVS